MRQRFEQQLSIDVLPISSVEIPNYTRDELPPALKALQHIFITPSLNEQVFCILENAIMKGKKKTGRTGMDLWHILVLGIVRMTLDVNHDRMWHIANNDKLVRKIMGIESTNGFLPAKEFSPTAIRENIKLLDESTIDQINEIVVKAGHKMVKKKEEKLEVKVDTYVFESNVHFPTDINLLWDSARKCLDMISKITYGVKNKGWRKTKHWYRKLKIQMRVLSSASQGGGKDKENRIKKACLDYLQTAKLLVEKIQQSKPDLEKMIGASPRKILAYYSLNSYIAFLIKHIDLLERRIIKGEKIPHDEKLFSIFEPHTEWITKGKANNKVELGHKILVSTDQFDFVLKHRVVEKMEDVELSVSLVDQLIETYGQHAFSSISFDKGFYKKENKELIQLFIPQTIMPKKGKKNKIEEQEESERKYKKLRNRHSAVESNINAIEHHGLNRCPDKGLINYKKYTSLGILAYNLHRLGNFIIKQEVREQKDVLLKAA